MAACCALLSFDGAALFASFGDVSGVNWVVIGHDEAETTTVQLEGDSVLEISNGHFNGNSAVFSTLESSLTLLADFGDCDPLDPLDFAANRYCSEIRANAGRLLLAGDASDVFLRTTALMENVSPADEVYIEVEDGATLQVVTNLFALNNPDGAVDPTLIQVDSGGTLLAVQSSFGDDDIPVRYLAGALGDYQRNAMLDPGGGDSVEVDVAAVITASRNVGDGSTLPTAPVANDPGFVTDVDRGVLHLGCTSPALDRVLTDGPVDIEGRARPIDVGGLGGAGVQWDAGAIELDGALCP
jgi:hypothetical protein